MGYVGLPHGVCSRRDRCPASSSAGRKPDHDYGRSGFFEKNELGRYSVNSVTARAGDDGCVTINFGGDPSLPNHLPIMAGWNYVVRLYQPGPPILDGSWTFPALQTAPTAS